MSFRQWQGLKDAVHTSMHWATPKLAGRMLNNGENPSAKADELSDEEILQHLHRMEEAGGGEGGEPPQGEEEETNESPHEKAAKGEGDEARAEDPEADEDEVELPDEVLYPPTNFSELGLRVESPDPEWGWDRPEEELRAERLERYNAVREEDKGKDDGMPKINEVRHEGMMAFEKQAILNQSLFRASLVPEGKERRKSCSDGNQCSLSPSHPPPRHRHRRGRRRREGSNSRRGKTLP